MHSNRLVVAREDHRARGVAAVAVEGLLQGCGLFSVQVVGLAVPTPQLRRRPDAVHATLLASDHVALDDHRAVRRVRKRNVELLGVTDSLLESISRGTVCTLGLDDGHRQARTDLQDVVDTAIG